MSIKVGIAPVRQVINDIAVDDKFPVQEYERAWNDAARGVEESSDGGSLSNVGPNITDCYIAHPDGGIAPFIKPPNHDEIIGVVDPGMLYAVHEEQYVSLKEIGKKLGKYIAYKGFGLSNALSNTTQWGFRSQSAWVATTDDTPRAFGICALNYNTYDASDPKNLILVCTPTGIYAHVDVVGCNKLYAHVIEKDGGITNHLFKAEATNIAVGHAQESGVKRARSEDDITQKLPNREQQCLGFQSNNARNDIIMVVTIPLQQKSPPSLYRSLGGCQGAVGSCAPSMLGQLRAQVDDVVVATASAARLSLGDAVSIEPKASLVLEVDNAHPPVVTMMSYAVLTAKQGTTCVTVSKADTILAINAMKRDYEQCVTWGKLSQFQFMLSKLTKEHVAQIALTKAVVEEKTKKEGSLNPFVPSNDPKTLVVDPFKPSGNAMSSFFK